MIEISEEYFNQKNKKKTLLNYSFNFYYTIKFLYSKWGYLIFLID